MMRVVLGVVCALLLVSNVQADERHSAYIDGLASFERTDDVRDAKLGYGGELIFGLPVLKNLNLEFSGFADGLKRSSDPRVDGQWGLGLDANIGVSDGKIATFLIAGGGGEYDRLTDAPNHGGNDKVLAPYVDGGVGAMARLTRHIALRGEARYYVLFNKDSYPGKDPLGDVRFNLGLQYAFGTVIPATVKKKEAPVYAPVAEAPAIPEPDLDSDGDGVPDTIDACPNTPAGAAVDAKGCPLDSDGDGVADYLDKCPGTPKSFKVDETGCIVEQTVVLHNVNFEFGSDKLTADAQSFLDEVTEGLRAQPTLDVEISGHTDSLGTQAYNLRLSERRAKAVRAYLVTHGIAASRLKAEGMGEFSPIATNKTEEGRAQNRRVEFKLKNEVGPEKLVVPNP